jgi:hypothetical protein
VWKLLILIAIISTVVAPSTRAASENSLKNACWIVVAKTTVSGTFNGCNYDFPVPLEGVFTFLCKEYHYHYAFRPDFIVMEVQGARNI